MGSLQQGGLVLAGLPSIYKPAVATLLQEPWSGMRSIFKRTLVEPRLQTGGRGLSTNAVAERLALFKSQLYPPATSAGSSILASSDIARLAARRSSDLHPVCRSFNASRPFSTLPAFSYRRFNEIYTPTIGQSRAFGSGAGSQHVLANLEQASNNNPANPNIQAQFYSALMRAGMPQIVTQRYNSGRYASNRTCDNIYVKALEKMGNTVQAGVAAEQMNQSPADSLSTAQIQAIGNAVASSSPGATIAVSRPAQQTTYGTQNPSYPQGNGNKYGEKENPIYVVVEESTGATVFKWVKFLLIFGLVAYFALVFLTLAVETTGMIRKVGGGQSKEAQAQQQTVRFSDVHGCEEAKEELQDLVEFLKNPDQFSNLGGKLPKGVLLVGPPGTGKTLLARAVAGEAGVPFFFMSGSEFDEVYVGVGAKRVRELFANARAKAPAIVFIDELDAIGSKRNERDAAYNKQTLNQLLVDLDGFSQNSGVIFLAATNFPQLLDKALTRPGRFDRNVVVPLPDVKGRAAILKHHMGAIRYAPDVDPTLIARGTPGFSGAELENLVNQAAVHASKNRDTAVRMHDFEWAKDKIMMGAERRSAIIPLKDRKMTAYHEGGHTLVGLFTEGHMPVYKVTIMPRGQALGVTHFLPEGDQVSMSKRDMLAHIDSALGGKIAEELIYGADMVTTGCSNDLENATRYARAMVIQYGMSDAIGDVNLANHYDSLPSKTKELVENEVRRIMDGARARATAILTKHRTELDRIADALVEYESLDRDEIMKVMKGEKLVNKIKLSPDAAIKLPEPPKIGVDVLNSEKGPKA